MSNQSIQSLLSIRHRRSTSLLAVLPIAAAFLAAALLSGCSGGSGGADTASGPEAELREARQKWQKASLENYTFQFRWQCFCLVEYVSLVELTVENGAIRSGRYVEGDSALSSERLGDYVPIDELFDVIEEALDRDAHSIRAEYDPELGYPVDVYIDYNEMMADEEKGFTIEAFVE